MTTGLRIVDRYGRCAMDEDDLQEALDPLAHCDREWPDSAPHRWEPGPPAAVDVRSLAVEVVDFIHGYTVEFSNQPNAHEADYDWVEDRLRTVLSHSAPSGVVPAEADNAIGPDSAHA